MGRYSNGDPGIWRRTTNSLGIGSYGAIEYTGILNTCVGPSAGANLGTGRENTIVGSLAGRLATTARELVAVGCQAADGVIGARRVTAVGYQSGLSANGDRNTFIGAESGADCTTGANNTIIGTHRGVAGMAGTVLVSAGQTAVYRYDPTNGYQFPLMSAVAESVAPTHSAVVDIGGTKYRILLAAI